MRAILPRQDNYGPSHPRHGRWRELPDQTDETMHEGRGNSCTAGAGDAMHLPNALVGAAGMRNLKRTAGGAPTSRLEQRYCEIAVSLVPKIRCSL